MRLAITMISAALLSSCSEGTQELSFNAGEAAYRIPADHTLSVGLQPQKSLVIKAPATTFEILFNDRSQGLDLFGWPIIPMMNDRDGPDVSRQAAGDLKVVCRRGGASWGDCAFKVKHERADWIVRFPHGQLANAQAIREKAIKLLDAYRASAEDGKKEQA